MSIFQKVQPNEIYNLGAQSHVGVSFEQPEYTANVDSLGTLRLPEAIRTLGMSTHSTSELYDTAQEFPQTKPSVRRSIPVLPTASTNCMPAGSTVILRSGGGTFVTRKITRGLAWIREGLQSCLYLGNLDAKRDWGHARDYVEMQWLMLSRRGPKIM